MINSTKRISRKISGSDNDIQESYSHYSDSKFNSRIFSIIKEKKSSSEIYTESIDEEYDEDFSIKHTRKRISAYSRVNFSKLDDKEKDLRLKNLSSLITRLRKKLRNIDAKYNSINSKNIKSLLGKQLSEEFNDFDFDKLIKALKIIKNFKDHEYHDQKNILENLIDIIAEERLSLGSINFKKICSQVRQFLNVNQIKYISKIGQKIIYSFPDKEVVITPSEYEYYRDFKNDEKIMRCILGLEHNKEYPNVINFNDNQGDASFEPSNTTSNSVNVNVSNNKNLLENISNPNQIFNNHMLNQMYNPYQIYNNVNNTYLDNFRNNYMNYLNTLLNNQNMNK